MDVMDHLKKKKNDDILAIRSSSQSTSPTRL